jgi:hypothetical protein
VNCLWFDGVGWAQMVEEEEWEEEEWEEEDWEEEEEW